MPPILAACTVTPPFPGSLFGTSERQVARLYSGPQRPITEVGIVAVANSQIDVYVRFVDGVRTDKKIVFHLLPGEAMFQVDCRRLQPRDPLGTWRGREILQADIQAGHKYYLRTKTKGPGRPGS